MTRYSTMPGNGDMTLNQFIEVLLEVRSQGFQDSVPCIYSVDAEEWLPITGMTYGEGKDIRFYTDEP